jgi:hypothetical protein
LFSDRHARPEHGTRNGEAHHFCSPSLISLSVTDQRAGKGQPSIPVETDFLTRPFTRQRRGLPCGFPRSRVNAPGLCLQNHPGSSASPVRFLAPHLGWPVVALLVVDLCDGTRCKAFLPGLFVCLQAATPLRDLGSLGIVVLSLTSDEDVCLCRLPDLPSLPAALPIIAYLTCASDHRSGSATSCQAHCSSKLLEPALECTHLCEESIEKQGFSQ